MPAIIDSAPSCVTSVDGAKPADDSADFIIQAAYENCAGIMTFGPGSTYGEEGAAAAGAYYVVTWIGIIVMIAVIVYWVYLGEPQAHELDARGGHRWITTRTGRSSSRRCRRTRRSSRPSWSRSSIAVRDRRARRSCSSRTWARNSGRRCRPHGRGGAADPCSHRPAGGSGAAGRCASAARGVLGVVALLAVTIVAAQSCQQSQVRLSKEAAIATARPQAGFTPERTQVRLVRQGLTGHPFWAVSFSVPAPVGRRLHEAHDRARRRQQRQGRGGQPGE